MVIGTKRWVRKHRETNERYFLECLIAFGKKILVAHPDGKLPQQAKFSLNYCCITKCLIHWWLKTAMYYF